MRLIVECDEDRPFCGCRRFELQLGVLAKDRPLELLKRRARLDSELVDERPARVLIDGEGLGLPARPVQRGHQTHPQVLAERVLGDECLELCDQLVVAPEREVGIDSQLDRRQPDLLEPGDRGLREVLVGKVRERRAPPERERVAQPCRRLRGPTAAEQAPALVHQPLEAMEIQVVGLDPEDVAGGPGLQHVLRKRLAESRDVDPQRTVGPLGRVLPPELVDQAVTRNDLVVTEQEHGQQGARLLPAQ